MNFPTTDREKKDRDWTNSYRALLAESSGILPSVNLGALALSALATSVAGAQLADVFAVGRDAGVVGGAALARGVS